MAQGNVKSFSAGLNYEAQKFDQFLFIRAQLGTKNPFAMNLGLSPVKLSQQVFHPSFGMDYARIFECRRFRLGPAFQFSSNSYVFGNRFWYVNASVGYRILFGQKIQFLHQACFGYTLEGFKNQQTYFQQFTMNYSIKFGMQYVIR